MDKDRAMSALQKALWEFLCEHFAGVKNAAPRKRIKAKFLMAHPDRRVSDRKFREAVEELVVIFKKPIASTPSDGYYVGRTIEEIRPSAYYLIEAGGKTTARGRALLETIPLERQGILPL